MRRFIKKKTLRSSYGFSGSVNSAGVTLVELLVAMFIGLFILNGAVSVMVGSKNNFVMEQEIAFIQENARFLASELGHEIRMAGYFGCSTSADLTNTLNHDVGGWMYASKGVQGYEVSDAGASALPTEFSDARENTDVLVINRGESSESLRVSYHEAVRSRMRLSQTHAFNAGDILMVEDTSCSRTLIFKMIGPASRSRLVEYAAGAPVYGSCSPAPSDSNGIAYDCPGDTLGPLLHGYRFRPGSAVMAFKSSAFFVKNSDITGVSTLYRSGLERGRSVARELVSGVEDFQVIYGVDVGLIADGKIDRYYNATELKGLGAENSWFDWRRVLNVRVTVVLKSNSRVYPSAHDVDLGGDFNANNYEYLSSTRYLYQKIVVTGNVRNGGSD